MARVGRQASEAVRASERRLAEVLEAIGEAVFAMDRAECILFANRKALELWNKPAEEVADPLPLEDREQRDFMPLGFELQHHLFGDVDAFAHGADAVWTCRLRDSQRLIKNAVARRRRRA